jgi:type VI secretion system secreted protein Hcp
MAETVHLYLKLNGTEIQGESSQSSLGRANSIEILSWSWGAQAPTSASGASSGKQVMGEVRFVQRIDKSTPLLFKGFANNEAAEGVFKFFRPNPTGDGTTEQFFTFEGKAGRITSLNPWNPDTINPATAAMPPLVQFTMFFQRVIQTYANGGITFDWDTSSRP